MNGCRIPAGLMLLPLLLLITQPSPAPAVIMVLTPLKQPLEKEQFIFVVKVQEILPDRPAMVLVPTENLKGEAPFDRLPINLTGDSEATKDKHTQILLDRLEKDLPIILFVSKRGKKYTAFGYTNGTWFSLEGRIESIEGKEVTRWSFLHCEPYLRRTFKGTTNELKQVIVDYVKHKKEPPTPNAKEPPGYGQPLKKASLAPRNGAPNILLGVIQIPFMGVIAALAALFPTVFGGLAIFIRRWLAFLSTTGIISIVYFMYMQYPKWIRWTGMTSIETMWFTCSGIAALGGLWAAERYRRSISAGKAAEMQPRKWDRIVLWTLFAVFSGIVIYGWTNTESLRASPWPEFIIAACMLLAGSCCLAFFYWRCKRSTENHPQIMVTAETVMLWSLVVGFSFVGAYEFGRAGVKKGGVTQLADAKGRLPVLNPEPIWVFAPKDPGEILSSPCVTPEAIFVSVFHNEGLAQYGRVYALDPASGKELWRFDDEGDMKPVFCSPVYHDGRVYIGEGFHKDSECRLYCLDAKTGKPAWKEPFKIASHAESTPVIAENKIVFGAGNDGIYCLDLKAPDDAKREDRILWHYKGENGLHIDANPVIWEGKVYAGSGYSRTHQVNRIFCLDLNTREKNGKELWSERVEFSCYGSPLVDDGRVYFGLGNSTFAEQREPITGLLLCRDAITGKEIWNAVFPHTVIARPSADRMYIYVGCWDGNLYAVNRKDSRQGKAGTIAWSQEILGGRITATPLAIGYPGGRIADVVYAVGQAGSVAAIDTFSKEVLWSLSIQALTDMPQVTLAQTPGITIEEDGTRIVRRLYIGAGLSRGPASLPDARLFCFEEVTDPQK